MKIAHLALALATAATVAACSGDSGEEGDSTAPKMSPATIKGWNGPAARDVCHDKILDRLKSPSTAEFESLLEVELAQSLYEWTVSGYVDSQNGFGATVRSEYQCTVTPENEDQAMVSVDSLVQR